MTTETRQALRDAINLERRARRHYAGARTVGDHLTADRVLGEVVDRSNHLDHLLDEAE